MKGRVFVFGADGVFATNDLVIGAVETDFKVAEIIVGDTLATESSIPVAANSAAVFRASCNVSMSETLSTDIL
jgi:hypothetical protein